MYLCGAGGLLFPNISYDYKLSVFYVITILFYICYSPIYIRKTDPSYSLVNGRLEININRLGLLEYLFLILPLTVYPMTLFSYYYKLDLGFVISSNTSPLLIILLSICALIWIQIKDKEFSEI